MGFLRRLIGRARPDGNPEPDRRPAEAEVPFDAATADAEAPADAATADAEERAHELDLARFEQERTDDLVRRQQRYADRSWVPPAQGGPRRSDDEAPPER
jgi:hypothetical protein